MHALKTRYIERSITSNRVWNTVQYVNASPGREKNTFFLFLYYSKRNISFPLFIYVC